MKTTAALFLVSVLYLLTGLWMFALFIKAAWAREVFAQDIAPVYALGVKPLYIFLTATVVTVLTPLLTVVASTYTQRSNRMEDRKDRAEAARLLVESNARVAAQAQRTDERTNGQLKQIHTLVNNNLTTAIAEAYDSKIALLAGLKEVVALKTALGQPVSHESLAVIATTESKIAELGVQLSDRKKAAETIEREQKANPVEQK